MRLIEALFPQIIKCIFCGEESEQVGVCDECYSTLPFISGKTCMFCGGRLTGDEEVCYDCKSHEILFNQNFCVFEYIDQVKSKILSFKQNGIKNIGYVFADFMLEKFKSLDIDFDLVTPVPIHENRLKERGFNQSEILASGIKSFCGKVDINIFTRIKDTPHQTGLSRENREMNLDGAFVVQKGSKLKDKNILLIDDIYTTGSTLNECAKSLFLAGAKSVYSLCLARAVINSSNVLDKDIDSQK